MESSGLAVFLAAMAGVCTLRQNDALPLPSVTADGVAQATAAASQLYCPLTATCPYTEMRKLWAQETVNGDLMLDEVKRLGVPPGSTRVGVVDTGFDEKRMAYMGSQALTVKKIYGGSGDLSLDLAGHGTATTSLIGGRDGLGMAPDAKLTVYAVSRRGETVISGRILDKAIQKACSDGNEVINYSFGATGDIGDETGEAPWEKERADFLKGLNQRGCLLVQAIGNDAYQDRNGSANDPDDSLLRVASVSRYGGLAYSSTAGEIDAPGEEVYSLYSSSAQSAEPDPFTKAEQCGALHAKMESGTSLAAPIVAGIAAQVVGVLKLTPKYGVLSGPDRVRLLDRILLAGRSGKVVDGLKAVTIAEKWNTGTLGGFATAAELERLLKSAPAQVCAGDTPDCGAVGECGARRACFDRLRARVSLCPGLRNDDFEAILKSAIPSKNLELIGYWAQKYRDYQSAHMLVSRYALPPEARAFAKFALMALADPRTGETAMNAVHKLRLYADLFGIEYPPDPDLADVLLTQAQREVALKTADFYHGELWRWLARTRIADANFLFAAIRSKAAKDAAMSESLLMGAALAAAAARFDGASKARILTEIAVSPGAGSNVLVNVVQAIGTAQPPVEGGGRILSLVKDDLNANDAVLRAIWFAIGEAPARSHRPIEGADDLDRFIIASPRASSATKALARIQLGRK